MKCSQRYTHEFGSPVDYLSLCTSMVLLVRGTFTVRSSVLLMKLACILKTVVMQMIFFMLKLHPTTYCHPACQCHGPLIMDNDN